MHGDYKLRIQHKGIMGGFNHTDDVLLTSIMDTYIMLYTSCTFKIFHNHFFQDNYSRLFAFYCFLCHPIKWVSVHFAKHRAAQVWLLVMSMIISSYLQLLCSQPFTHHGPWLGGEARRGFISWAAVLSSWQTILLPPFFYDLNLPS